MKYAIHMGILVAILSLTACDQQKSQQAAQKSETSSAKPKNPSAYSVVAQTPEPSQVGRYVIIHSPIVERDTVLLDTVTGKTWQMIQETDLNGEPLEWSPMARTDNFAEFDEVIRNHGIKKPTLKPKAESQSNSDAPSTPNP